MAVSSVLYPAHQLSSFGWRVSDGSPTPHLQPPVHLFLANQSARQIQEESEQRILFQLVQPPLYEAAQRFPQHVKRRWVGLTTVTDAVKFVPKHMKNASRSSTVLANTGKETMKLSQRDKKKSRLTAVPNKSKTETMKFKQPNAPLAATSATVVTEKFPNNSQRINLTIETDRKQPNKKIMSEKENTFISVNSSKLIQSNETNDHNFLHRSIIRNKRDFSVPRILSKQSNDNNIFTVNNLNETQIFNSEDFEDRQFTGLGNTLNDGLLPAPVFLVGLIFLAFLAQFYWVAVLNTVAQTSSASASAASSSSSTGTSGSASAVQSPVVIPTSFIIPTDELMAVLQQASLTSTNNQQFTSNTTTELKTNQTLLSFFAGSVTEDPDTSGFSTNGTGTSEGIGENGSNVSGSSGTDGSSSNDSENGSNTDGETSKGSGGQEISTSSSSSSGSGSSFSGGGYSSTDSSIQGTEIDSLSTNDGSLTTDSSSQSTDGGFQSTEPGLELITPNKQGITMPLLQLVTPAPAPSYMMKMPVNVQGLIPW